MFSVNRTKPVLLVVYGKTWKWCSCLENKLRNQIYHRWCMDLFIVGYLQCHGCIILWIWPSAMHICCQAFKLRDRDTHTLIHINRTSMNKLSCHNCFVFTGLKKKTSQFQSLHFFRHWTFILLIKNLFFFC